MNKKGFTLIELLATMALMTIIMSFAIPSILGMMNDNKKEKYQAYERSSVEYAKAYFEDETTVVGLSALREHGLTFTEECTGYVSMREKKAYIKCGDEYETEGYDENKAS